MRVGMWLAGLAVSLVGMAAACAAPLEVYGRLPGVERLTISPDGALLGMIVTNGEERLLAVTRLADNKVVERVSFGDVKIRQIAWAGSENMIVTISQTAAPANIRGGQREWLQALGHSVVTGKTWPLLSGAGKGSTGTLMKTGPAMNVIAGLPQVRILDGKPAVFLVGYTFQNNRGVLTLYRTDADHDSSRQVAVGNDEKTRNLLVDEGGEVIARSTYDDATGRWGLLLKNGVGARETGVTVAPIDTPWILGLGRDGKNVLVQHQRDDGIGALEEVSPAGVWSGPIIPDGDPDRVIFDPVRHNLIGYASLVGEDLAYTFFDPADQRLWKGVAAAFAGQRVSLESWSDDRQKIVVRVDSPENGPAFALVDRARRTAVWLGPAYTGLTPQDIAPVRPIAFKAQDGLPLTGYLTLPRGVVAKDLPLVVLPHGGPAVRDMPQFDWWAQALASRGYAVLQVNYRGSDGFGWAFMKAGFGEWGRKMQTDLSDGVRYLAEEEIIDSKRVCIAGASYGGYAALAGATIDRGVYRCAAAYGGVSDLRKLVNNAGHQGTRYWERFMGVTSTGDPMLAQYSPVRQAARADIPVLLVHGKDDTVVLLGQSLAMADALKKAGKTVELVVLKGEDHWLTSGETRLAMLKAVVAFLEKYNPPT